ncbi:MAG: D-alanine--D-alanine ligase [Gemmatimonadetes bacterium]|nr:D-alanine--D-alanine ligase [Gemmatimonadota bacterium]
MNVSSEKQKKLRIGVLFGGRSGEHDVSLVSAKAVMKTLRASGRYEVVPIGITREGDWIVHPKAHALLAQQSQLGLGGPKPAYHDEITEEDRARGGLGSLVANQSARRPVDVIFPVLHGPMGEDGTVQGFLELTGIPYVGSGVAGSALCMDKDLFKRIARDAGLDVAPWVAVSRASWRRDPDSVRARVESLRLPLFVKPANMGSSVGISKISDIAFFDDAMNEAAKYDTKIVIEEGIDAREIECGVLGNDEPMASLPGEIVPAGEFYDYAAKYVDDTSALYIPADLPKKTMRAVQKAACRAFVAAECAGMARVDFLLDRNDGTIYLNEINTIPGFTPISMYSKMWDASGIPYDELLDRLIALAIERHDDRADVTTHFALPGDAETE